MVLDTGRTGSGVVAMSQQGATFSTDALLCWARCDQMQEQTPLATAQVPLNRCIVCSYTAAGWYVATLAKHAASTFCHRAACDQSVWPKQAVSGHATVAPQWHVSTQPGGITDNASYRKLGWPPCQATSRSGGLCGAVSGAYTLCTLVAHDHE